MDQPKQCLAHLKQLLNSIEATDLPQEYSSPFGCAQNASLPMQLDVESPGALAFPRDAQTSPTALKNLPGRGMGVVATRFIPAGSLILQDNATLTLTMPEFTTLEVLSTIVSQYVDCSAEVQQQLLSLHACNRADLEKGIRSLLATDSSDLQLTEHQVDLINRIYSTFTTNMFGHDAPGLSSVYLEASRFNHSCLPNCDYVQTAEGNHATITIRASRDIQVGEELCVTYVINYEERSKRMADLEQYWGFACNCPACDIGNRMVDTPAHEGMLAEYRRLRDDPLAKAFVARSPNTFSLEDLHAALDRSIRRGEIAQVLGDVYTQMTSHITSGNICKGIWFWTGHVKDVRKQIRFLEQALLLSECTGPLLSAQELTTTLEWALDRAQNLESRESRS